ncbi:hypothetical protein [Niabella ginsengisoli]|uniref:DUF3313 domain-containing protein n=1 Tax=Niabella ginsengisoli TaxID=522298 RepID=A0ABS9SNA1_9BACT|nr:hypothetical protein [Niabella ginsengisoli]MCH5599866.1 hypothetical protein [Niabella ginsengisoli]
MRTNSLFIFVILMIATTVVNAQKIKLNDGDKKVLSNETSVNIEFSYDNVSVGKFKNEEEYIAKKKEEYNKKEAGKGDKWAEDWKSDRNRAFEPQFIEQFLEKSDLKNSKDAKYTLVFATTFIEPGFNVGVVRKNAYINATVTIAETANRNNIVATIDVEKSPGRDAMGYDFDTSWRISEAYAKAGKSLAKFLGK